MIKLNNILLEENPNKIYLSPEEREEAKQLFGKVQCSFAKNKNGKYYCYTHRARSKYYDNLKDIPKKKVNFISSTS